MAEKGVKSFFFVSIHRIQFQKCSSKSLIRRVFLRRLIKEMDKEVGRYIKILPKTVHNLVFVAKLG